MNGILLIDKPSGWTSFDVVAKVRGILRTATRNQQLGNSPEKLISNSSLQVAPSPKVKVGHAGTLDPLATGLLVILVGDYCKRASEFSKLDKVYEVTMKLGETSTTGDDEGEKTHMSDEKPSKEAVLTALGHFTGEIMQTPHAYSAIKVNGQRAYKLARTGKEVVIEPRKVTIYEITDVKYIYPEIKFTTKVSSGTYVRSLVEDMGKELSTGAYMTALRRTQIGDFNIKGSIKPTDVVYKNILDNLLTK